MQKVFFRHTARYGRMSTHDGFGETSSPGKPKNKGKVSALLSQRLCDLHPAGPVAGYPDFRMLAALDVETLQPVVLR